jgi:hypothetical protein
LGAINMTGRVGFQVSWAQAVAVARQTNTAAMIAEQ